MTPAEGSDTTTAWSISGRMGYRPHNADRSERGLLNILPRIILGFPSRAAKQGRGNESVSGGDREPRLTEPQRDSCQVVPLAELRLIEV